MVRDNSHGDSSRSRRPFRTFGTILYEMVDDPSTDSIISWSESGKSFIVWNQYEFCRDLVSRVQTNNMSNFSIRLGNFGFRKVESEQWEYANENFVRGKPELTEEIEKRYWASLSPDIKTIFFKRKAEEARRNVRISALHMAIKERALVKNLSNLTL